MVLWELRANAAVFAALEDAVATELGDARPICLRLYDMMSAERCGEASDQCGEHGSVGPVETRPRVGSAEYGDLVA